MPKSRAAAFCQARPARSARRRQKGAHAVICKPVQRDLRRRRVINDDPVAIGAGRTMFDGAPVSLRLIDSRMFKNGKTFLSYELAS